MKELNLAEKLRKRRELLNLNQDYMAMKMNMSQPGYSLIENGKTKLTEEQVEKIKTIKGFEDFDGETPEQAEKLVAYESIFPKWPWGRTSRNIALIVVSLLLINQASIFADDVSRGFGAGTGRNNYITLIIAIIVFTLFALFIYLLFLAAKWWLIRRRRVPKTL